MHVQRPGILCRAAGKAGVSEHAVLPLKGSHDCSAACIKRHRARSNGGPDSFTLKQTTPLLSRHISAAAGAAAVRGQSRNSAQQRLIESHQTTHSRVRFSFQSLPFLSQGSLISGSTRHAIRQLNSRGISHLASRTAHRPSPASVAAVLSLLLLPLLVIGGQAAATASHPTSADHHSRDYSASSQSTSGGHTRAGQCQSSNRIPEVVFFNTCSI